MIERNGPFITLHRIESDEDYGEHKVNMNYISHYNKVKPIHPDIHCDAKTFLSMNNGVDMSIFERIEDIEKEMIDYFSDGNNDAK